VRVFISAGEVSSDRIGAAVLTELRCRHPAIVAFGLGGPALADAGLERWGRGDRLAVAGLTEALSALPAAAGLVARFAASLVHRRRRPQLALLVDSPGINLRLAWLCKRAGVPVLQVVAPQRWAWLSWRARALPELVDALAVTLPFEQAWFRERGVNATFVGHPLVDRAASIGGGGTRAAGAGPAVAERVAATDRPALLGLFPGSRRHEIARHLPLLREVARSLQRTRGLDALLAVANPEAAQRCADLAPELPQAPAQELLQRATVALAASGTITLELALADIPQVVLYRLSSFSAAAARLLLRVDHVALPNLLCGRQVVPELLQRDASPARLGDAVRRLLDEPAAQRAQLAAYAEIQDTLGPAGFAARVADLAAGLLAGGYDGRQAAVGSRHG
jgi:lipid-A-disaccharide synthase